MILQTDLLWYTALRAGLADMRKNLFVLDDAYSDLLCDPYLKDLYGQKEIDNIRGFIGKKINIFTEHRTPDKIEFPCIAIKVGPGEEDNPKDALGDSYQQELVNPDTLGGTWKSPQIVLGPVTPIEFEPLTGQLTFGDGVDLTKSNVFEGQFVYDEKNKKAYEIKLVIDSSNLLIEEGLSPSPNLTNMTVRPIKNMVGHIRRSIWVWENITLTFMATDAVEVLYLYTIVTYMLGRYKKTLWDARNFQVSSISYSEIIRINNEPDPNLVYGRTLSVRGRVEHSVIESTSDLIQGVSHELKIADMKTPDALEDQVAAQGWSGSEDEF